MRLRVSVFPVSSTRWIAAVDAPLGAFSTESARAEDVPAATEAAIVEVLGGGGLEVEFVDDLGAPWSPLDAARQRARLGVEPSSPS